MNQQSNIIVQSSNNGISRIKLNEPSTYNALSLNTLKSLIECFKNFNDDEKTKVIIIEGSGKGFSAGHDLKEIRSLKKKLKYNKLFNACSKLMLEIVEGRKPVIAKVHGAAFAAGCQ
jgi:enoyl-CoA hydratase/carnithine racemase